MTIVDHIRPELSQRGTRTERPAKRSKNHIRNPKPETLRRFANTLLNAQTRGEEKFLPNRYRLAETTGFSYSTVSALMAHLEYHGIVEVLDRRGTRIRDRVALHKVVTTGELPVKS